MGAFGPVSFQAHVELLRLFLTHREGIVESIEALLNAQRKPIGYLQDRSLLSRLFEDCFFERTVVTASQTRLRGQLEAVHWGGGFRPRQVQSLHNDLIHPAEMMVRGFYCWQQTHWPGRNGRMHYAHTLFNLYLIRCLQFLSMRLWDEDPASAGGRLAEIRGVLDEIWRSSPADQPVIVRDARWLIPLAQSLITDELAPYFEVARQVTGTLPKADVLEIQRAHVRMLGGHLTSQIRYYCTKDGVPINDHSVVLRTRTSNALDFSLLVQGLVALLKAYDCARRSRDELKPSRDELKPSRDELKRSRDELKPSRDELKPSGDELKPSGDERMRLDMAGAIFQGISVDPELFLNRVDLLSAYSMIEHVFLITDGEGHAVYSPLGQRHVRLLQEYAALIGRLTRPLREDFPRFRPVDGRYSPYGVIFGLPSHLIEHMALKALQHDAETRFSLEDVFLEDLWDDGDTSAAKLAWVNGWRKLPHIDPGVQRQYDYPQQFAEDIYNRMERELSEASPVKPRDSKPEACDGSRTGRLYIVSEDDSEADSKASAIPELPARYFGSSDRQIVAAHKAEPCDRAQLLHERREAHFLVSYETPGGWIGLKKELLTEVLGAGRDARIIGLPLEAAEVLRLMCTDLVDVADQASVPPLIEKA